MDIKKIFRRQSCGTSVHARGISTAHHIATHHPARLSTRRLGVISSGVHEVRWCSAGDAVCGSRSPKQRNILLKQRRHETRVHASTGITTNEECGVIAQVPVWLVVPLSRQGRL
jgi:hypothetical protein